MTNSTALAIPAATRHVTGTCPGCGVDLDALDVTLAVCRSCKRATCDECLAPCAADHPRHAAYTIAGNGGRTFADYPVCEGCADEDGCWIDPADDDRADESFYDMAAGR